MKKNLILCFFAPLFGFGQIPISTDIKAQTPSPVEWNTLDKTNFSVQYPTDWDLNDKGIMGTSFVILSQPDSATDNFRENISLLIQNLEGMNIDLDKYTEISEGQLKTLATNLNLVENKRIKNDSTTYQKVVYAADQGVFRLKFEQYYWVIGPKAYVLTFTTTEATFDRYKAVGERMMNSFYIKK
jgi:hypothetical protein